MFSHLRYFFWASVIIIITAAVIFGVYYRMSANELMTSQAGADNYAIARNFQNTIWPSYHNSPFQNRSISDNFTNEDQALYLGLIAETQKLLNNMPVLKFNLYAPQQGFSLYTPQQNSVSNFFSVNQSQVFDETNPYRVINPEGSKDLIIKSLQAQKPLSEIIYDADFTLPSGKKTNGVLVRTIIPLYAAEFAEGVQDPHATPETIVEVYFDVTKTADTLQSFQYWGGIFVVVIYMLLYAGLVFYTRRAEKIIVRQHETNLELAGAKARAETENAAKSQFLANISHELRTPLNAIIGFSEIMKDEVMGQLHNDQYKNYVKDIHSSGVHLLSLINDILDYSKAEAGKLDIEYEDVDLRKLIVSSLRLQEPRARTAEVELLKEIPDEPVVIRSDVKRLKQILLNLLSNAVKFTPAGGNVKVAIWRNLNGETISMEIKDSGIGIAPKDIAKALAPFGQVDSELSRRYEGTGLGLPLTKKFTELLGGSIKLESQINKGTTVTVTLPINASSVGVKRF